MKAIVATDLNWGIGKDNDLLVSLPPDMKFFRATTLDSVVVLGRKTLMSFPGEKPLPRRTHIVLTRDPNFACEGVCVAHSNKELKALLDAHKDQEQFLIGGASVYKQFIDYCEEALVTRMDKSFDAEVLFPNLDIRDGWECVDPGEPQDYEGLGFRFARYRNNKAREL